MKIQGRSGVSAPKFLILNLLILSFIILPVNTGDSLAKEKDLPIFAPQPAASPSPTPAPAPITAPPTESTPAASPSAATTPPPTQSISVPTPATTAPEIQTLPADENLPAPESGTENVIHAVDPILRTVSAHIYGGQNLPEGVALLTLIVSFFYLAAGVFLVRPDLFKFLAARKNRAAREPGGRGEMGGLKFRPV